MLLDCHGKEIKRHCFVHFLNLRTMEFQKGIVQWIELDLEEIDFSCVEIRVKDDTIEAGYRIVCAFPRQIYVKSYAKLTDETT